MRADTKAPADLSQTSGTSPPNLGDFPAHLFAKPEPMASGPTTYHVTDELWAAYSQEQLAFQTDRLKSTGRYRLPASFTGRLDFESVVNMKDYRAHNPGYVRDASFDSYFDFNFVGDKLVGIDQMIFRHFTEVGSAAWRLKALSYIKDPRAITKPKLYNLDNCIAWWDDDKTLASRFSLKLTSYDGELLAQEMHDTPRDVLACLLYDRSIYRVESEPRNQPHRHRNLLGATAQQRVQKITMYVPRRVSTAANGGTHASPHMHFRAEHLRNQPFGPRKSPSYREIVIPGKWINAADIDPSELGTPQRTVVLRGVT